MAAAGTSSVGMPTLAAEINSMGDDFMIGEHVMKHGRLKERLANDNDVENDDVENDDRNNAL